MIWTAEMMENNLDLYHSIPVLGDNHTNQEQQP